MKTLSALTSIMVISTLATTVDSAQAISSDGALATQSSSVYGPEGTDYGPQSPRNIDQLYGSNKRVFSAAPNRTSMNLCNIHFHASAEHQGGEFTTPAGDRWQDGFGYSGSLTDSQLKPFTQNVCPVSGKSLKPGDTIELHYVYSTANVDPGATLSSCLSDNVANPQLRVEAQVLVLVNDNKAADFKTLTEVRQINGYDQAVNIPTNTGKPVEYLGSTTGPSYNEQSSPVKVSWSVRPEVIYTDIATVGQWCQDNPFQEKGAHGVRKLVTKPEYLSAAN
ncbi:hypothetical protein HHX48_04250 [Salinimonas sp. HHU 13199]|uniref:Cadmium carbonic anhydrase n=1 Tax=Salinimonas profundi TaxID=2729140 RepID=A0ABR8LHF1_9ALTE|nr:delta-class carbonic anhydrase [Salinimonas profundi]MBD3584948.1 hypothetical protein [Salinimonas profundi]